MEKVEKLIDSVWEKVLCHRRWLHAHPELSGQEKNTSAYISRALTEMGLTPTENIGGYGVCAIIEGKGGDKCLGLRADFDALPLTEKTGLPFSSEDEGVFHACGHDMHTAILLGVAEVLLHLRDEFSGKVKLIFQPSEENAADSGAKKMIADGILENPKVDAILAQHVMPHYKTGEIAAKRGSMTSSSDRFYISVFGKSSHGSEPENGVDAITIGAQVISALQTVVSRSISPSDSAVISIGKVVGGARYNVIADRFDMEGTCRTLNPQVRESIPHLMENIIKGIAEGMGGGYEFKFATGFPPTMNSPEGYAIIQDSGVEIVGKDKFIIPEKTTMAGEDFSFYSECVPAGFYWLGCQKEGEDFYPLHNEHFSPDENAMKTGIGIMVSSVLNYLK